MGNSKQYTDEFRAEAVKQVIERGFTVVDVASTNSQPVGQCHQMNWAATPSELDTATNLLGT